MVLQLSSGRLHNYSPKIRLPRHANEQSVLSYVLWVIYYNLKQFKYKLFVEPKFEKPHNISLSIQIRTNWQIDQDFSNIIFSPRPTNSVYENGKPQLELINNSNKFWSPRRGKLCCLISRQKLELTVVSNLIRSPLPSANLTLRIVLDPLKPDTQFKSFGSKILKKPLNRKLSN